MKSNRFCYMFKFMKNISDFKALIQRTGRGFTLLEVMVALAIIAIVLVSVLRMQGQTISMNEAFRFYTIAPELAMSKMADIRLDIEDAVLTESGDFGEDFRGYNWQATVEDVTIETEEAREMEFKRVDVTVTYLENEHSLTVREYMLAESDEF